MNTEILETDTSYTTCRLNRTTYTAQLAVYRQLLSLYSLTTDTVHRTIIQFEVLANHKAASKATPNHEKKDDLKHRKQMREEHKGKTSKPQTKARA